MSHPTQAARRVSRGALAKLLALALAVLTSACASDEASGSYAEAAGTVAAAGAAWGVVGCTSNGCEPPFRCNGETKQCERIRCGEGESTCPPAYNCDLKDQLCK